jgi:NADH-quinone oxidoreductase subunit N
LNDLLPVFDLEFLIAALPVLILCVGSIVAMLQSVYSATKGPRAVAVVLYISLIAALGTTFLEVGKSSFLGGAYLSGHIARFGQGFVLTVGLVVALLFKETHQAAHFLRGEVSALYLMVFAGMLTMLSSSDFISLFIGLELSSIGLYALIGYISPSRKSQEGALKYFILGSFATAILLFGFGLLYASTGSLNLTEIVRGLAKTGPHNWVTIGGMLVITGLSFKMALVPFHMWAPDAYESAPTGITAIMATCVKIMLIIVTLRFFANGLEPIAKQWLPMLMFVATMSMIFGNILALVQSDLKRMLSYSSIAHSGYIAVAICAVSGTAALPFQAALFYLIGYTLTSLLAFGILMWLESEESGNLQLNDLAGLSRKHPWASFGLATAMFSFAGMPPTVGFIAKFFVFNAALQNGLYGLLIVGVIGSSISLYYYLRVIVRMYMTEPSPTSASFAPTRSFIVTAIVGAALIGTIAFGIILPGPTLRFLKSPAQEFLTKE